jgi:hypothetical protein
MSEGMREQVDQFDEAFAGMLFNEGNLKNFTMALSKHERVIMDSEYMEMVIGTLKEALIDTIDNFLNDKTEELSNMVAAKEEYDTNETAESAKELRQAYGMMIASDNAHDVAVSRTKAAAVVNKIKREISSLALDEAVSKYSKV